MKPQSNLLQARLWSGVLGMFCLVLPGPAHGGASPPKADSAASKPDKAIPWSALGARAGANFTGDGLAVSPDEGGARLRCVFQRLEGEANHEGLWLTSTAEGKSGERFRLKAVAVGRAAPCAQHAPMTAVQGSVALPNSGKVEFADQLARFIRPGLVEEYSVSMDGVRQDFVIEQKPTGEGRLRVELAVSGAKVDPSPYGAELVLEQSGRKIAYNRLRATDATGRELPARMEVQETAAFSLQPLAFHLALVVDDASAVYPIRIDPTFSDANWVSMGGIPGADDTVYEAVADGSGNLYIGGSFTIAGNVFASRIAKWNGSGWSALGSGMGGSFPVVYALAVSRGDLYAAGEFTTAGGVSATNIAKWDGSTWSALGSGISNGDVFALNPPSVRALAVSGSDLYAGGWFAKAGEAPATNIAKWNGSTWSALGSGVRGSDVNPSGVMALAVSGSDLYAGGQFSAAGEVSAKNIAKWNGSTWSALGSGMEGGVHALAMLGNDLYAGGHFYSVDGVPAHHIAKWNGSTWSALDSGMAGPGDPPPVVFALAVSGSDLYAGGWFYEAGGTPAYYIAKWNGSSWSAVSPPMNETMFASALAVSGSDLYVGGAFATVGGVSANSIAKWNGSNWSALSSGLGGSSPVVSALAVSGSDLYVGGSFTTAGEASAANIAKWNGSSWSALGSGMNERVFALAVSGSGLYAGGLFTTAGGNTVNYIAKWNGSSWSALSGMNGSVVWALAVSGTDLYAGGRFFGPNHIAKWNGSLWSWLGSGIDGEVYALAVSSSGLYVGGSFTMADRVLVNSIAKWNGSIWSPLGSGVNGGVSALAVSGSDLYVGGRFTTAGGVSATNIAKWNGSTWSALGLGVNGSVSALAMSGSDLYAAGEFTMAGGVPASNIAKWNGSSWSALGSGIAGGGPYASVSALAISGSNLYAGGWFTKAGGKVSPYLARAVLGDAPGYNQLTGEPSPNGAMQFSYIGYPATNYSLDRTFNLAPPVDWVGQQSNPMTVSGVLMFTNNPAPGTNNFWRVRSVP